MHLNVDSAIRAIQPNRALALSSAFERLIMVARNPANFLKTPQYHCVDPTKQLDLNRLRDSAKVLSCSFAENYRPDHASLHVPLKRVYINGFVTRQEGQKHWRLEERATSC